MTPWYSTYCRTLRPELLRRTGNNRLDTLLAVLAIAGLAWIIAVTIR